MLEVEIPGHRKLRLTHLVSDYNGTLACDGQLIPGLAHLIRQVSRLVEIHIVTADTFGLAKQSLHALPVELAILPPADQDRQKAAYIRRLGASRTVAIGNGRNDLYMLKDAALGICVMGDEGVYAHTMRAADVVCRCAHDALRLLLNPKRLVATLRK